MDAISQREPRVLWSFWISCGLAATGGLAPIVLAAGGTNRIAGAALPFGIAAMAMAVNALTYQRGRPLATSLYFLAGIALVYGMLSMMAVPLRLAVIGTCPPDPAVCPIGFERPFTTAEGSGFAIGIAMATLSIFVGFFGLLMLFRIRTRQAEPPPTRREAQALTPAAAVETTPPAGAEPASKEAPPPEPAAEPVITSPPPEPDSAAPAPAPKPARKPRVRRAPKPQAELPAPESHLELPAPAPEDPPSDAPTST